MEPFLHYFPLLFIHPSLYLYILGPFMFKEIALLLVMLLWRRHRVMSSKENTKVWFKWLELKLISFFLFSLLKFY